MPRMKIGTLARTVGCTVETIRYYEREGLLDSPSRSEGNYRLYREGDVDRLRFIRRCRSLDMTHEEIRALLTLRGTSSSSCTEVNALLDERIGHVAQRIEELKLLEAELRRLRSRCTSIRPAADCGILQALGRDSSFASTEPARSRVARRRLSTPPVPSSS